jgi:hypothetical protein
MSASDGSTGAVISCGTSFAAVGGALRTAGGAAGVPGLTDVWVESSSAVGRTLTATAMVSERIPAMKMAVAELPTQRNGLLRSGATGSEVSSPTMAEIDWAVGPSGSCE